MRGCVLALMATWCKARVVLSFDCVTAFPQLFQAKSTLNVLKLKQLFIKICSPITTHTENPLIPSHGRSLILNDVLGTGLIYIFSLTVALYHNIIANEYLSCEADIV